MYAVMNKIKDIFGKTGSWLMTFGAGNSCRVKENDRRIDNPDKTRLNQFFYLYGPR